MPTKPSGVDPIILPQTPDPINLAQAIGNPEPKAVTGNPLCPKRKEKGRPDWSGLLWFDGWRGEPRPTNYSMIFDPLGVRVSGSLNSNEKGAPKDALSV